MIYAVNTHTHALIHNLESYQNNLPDCLPLEDSRVCIGKYCNHLRCSLVGGGRLFLGLTYLSQRIEEKNGEKRMCIEN